MLHEALNLTPPFDTHRPNGTSGDDHHGGHPILEDPDKGDESKEDKMSAEYEPVQVGHAIIIILQRTLMRNSHSFGCPLRASCLPRTMTTSCCRKANHLASAPTRTPS
jgi:hypothetical protein